MDPFPLPPASWNRARSQPGAAPQTDIEWERIMVQITFAFVIILGFLISKGMSESQNLAQEADRQRRVNAVLQSIVEGYAKSELGQERELRIATQRQLQLERLLNRWFDLRHRRGFHELLVKFRKADLIPLADDLGCLPVGTDFLTFKSEIERIFLADREAVSAQEVRDLMLRVVEAAGFRPDAAAPLLDASDVSRPALALVDDPRVVTEENLTALKNQIVGDLQDERVGLADVQYDLVAKIATARLERLTQIPVDVTAADPSDTQAPELATRVFE
ncbi:MAG: hypothetical protein MUF48_10265, partial [Pirellulaceae bacterium]|nr:hypothetical protein [Pirellulaceae bacterium]